MTAREYIFADVAGIDISGEVLPQHDAQGAWRPERAEDWAFLAEAYGERALIEYKDSATARTQAQVEAKMAEIRGREFMGGMRVASAAKVWSVLKEIERMLEEGYVPKWCAGVPEEGTFEAQEALPLNWWSENCPEMVPARQLHVQGIAGLPVEERRWEAELLRAAYADLAANQCYVCENWYDRTRQTSRDQEGRIFNNVFIGEYVAERRDGRTEITWQVPDAPTLTLPEGAGSPRLAALFEVEVEEQNRDRWVLKVVPTDGITVQLLQSMVPEPSEEGMKIGVYLKEKVLIVPLSMRTRMGNGE